MEAALTATDPRFVKNSEHSLWQRIGLHFIRDERDLPFLSTGLVLSIAMMVPAALMYLPGAFHWAMVIPYYGLYFWYMGPYILMLHNTSHRVLFKKKYNVLNHYLPLVLAPFFGETPYTYFAHHIGMHHPENNLEQDLSSTMKYERSSFWGFAHYYFTFLGRGLIDLSIYLKNKKRKKFLKMAVLGELGYIAFAAALLWISPLPTLVVFVLPVVITRLMMMSGNWAQHAFIDPKDPANPHKNSITCIDSLYNRRCFNDGYHIGHHVKAARHWTEMPDDFMNNIERYAQDEAVVFKQLDYFLIWSFLMTKQFKMLAKFYVPLSAQAKAWSLEERAAFLKSRTHAILPADSANEDIEVRKSTGQVA